MTFSLETVRRVFDDSDGVYLEVGPDPDGLGLVQVSTVRESAEHYGTIRLVLLPEQARLLAAALNASASEMELAQKKS